MAQTAPPPALSDEAGEPPAALAPAPDQAAPSIDVRLADGKRRVEKRLAQSQENARTRAADAELKPFFLIPDHIWNSDDGAFLMTALDLYPFDDWNVVFLAADRQTALALDIAPHPNGNVAPFIAAAERHLVEARSAIKRAEEEAELLADSALLRDTREDIQLRIKGLALSFARTLIEAWDQQKPEPS